MVACGCGRLREFFITLCLSHSSNGVSLSWSLLELVAYETGHKESFDCIGKEIYIFPITDVCRACVTLKSLKGFHLQLEH